MTTEMMITLAITSIIALIMGYISASTVLRKSIERKSENILKDAEKASEQIKKDKILQAKEKFIELKSEHEKFINSRNQKISDLESLVDDKTVAILYNFPSNPTGGTLDESQRDELLEFAQRHNLWLISDEVYDRIVFDGPHVSFMGTGYERVLLVNSFSKTFAMTGWRMGYIISTNLEAMQQIIKMQYYITACSTDAMQYGILTAMNQASEYPDVLAKEFKQRCDLIVERLNAMPGVECHKPKGAIYVFPRVTVPNMTSEDIAMELLKDGVLCSPGSAFGPSGEGHLRFAYTISQEDITRGMDKVEATLRRLQSH